MSIVEDGILHGADYNYEQWLGSPGVFEKDREYMKQAGINVLTVGVFSWSNLESEEGKFHFEWLDELFEAHEKNGQKIILATPSGGRPPWMCLKYPETGLMTAGGVRKQGGRHNHCRSSPAYRELCAAVNTRLAERYGKRRSLILWHVSNEYNGEPCYCPDCIAAFREWLKKKYASLDALNEAWCSAFWSHRFSRWEEIFPGDESIDGLALDWQRFTSDQTIDFYEAEAAPLRRISPHIPVTTNFQMPDVGLDYHEFARHVDIVSWDNYPRWHQGPSDTAEAQKAAFFHDLQRSYKRQPFLMMESSPGAVNWQGVSKKKKKGMHLLSSMQALAHGADSVQYFQWRQSRGGAEKFHDAVISHFGADTEIFREVSALGGLLPRLRGLAGAGLEAEAALVYDYQNGWALDKAQLPRNIEKNYQEECVKFHGAFWRAGVSCDVIGSGADFGRYRLLVIPMLYMMDPSQAAAIRSFVEGGGIAAATYLTGIVNSTGLCYPGGTPGGLLDVFGIAVEHTDAIAACEERYFSLDGKTYRATHYADAMRLKGARILGSYGDSPESLPALTCSAFGRGHAYYLGCRTGPEFLDDFFRILMEKHRLRPCVPWTIAPGVSVQKRGNFIFVMNFNEKEVSLSFNQSRYEEVLKGTLLNDTINLGPYGILVMREARQTPG
jgi:beta-galactosidase